MFKKKEKFQIQKFKKIAMYLKELLQDIYLN